MAKSEYNSYFRLREGINVVCKYFGKGDGHNQLRLKDAQRFHPY